MDQQVLTWSSRHIEEAVDAPRQVIGGDLILEPELVEQLLRLNLQIDPC